MRRFVNHLSLLLALLLTPFFAFSQSDYEKYGSEFKYGENEPQDAIDPVTSRQNMPNVRLMEFLFESLLVDDPNGTAIPQLAVEMPTIKGREVLFKLKEGVRWHDGTPFTAEDVKFSYMLYQNPDTFTEPFNHKVASRIEQCIVIDDFTVKFVLKEARKNPYGIFSLKIIPKHAIGKPVLRPGHPFTKNPIGTGPYKFVKQKENSVWMAVNEDYHNQRAYIDEAVMEYVPDQRMMLSLLLSDSGLDAVIELRPKDIVVVESTGKFNLLEYNSMSFNYIGYNLKNPILGIKKIRYAIALGIDRQEILAVPYLNKGQLVSGPFPPNSIYNNPDIDPQMPPFMPDKAAELLAEVGCVDSNGDGVLELDGQPLEFEMIVRVEDNDVPAALAIQDYLKQIGVKINLKHMATETIKSVVFKNKNFDMALLGWVFDSENDVSSLFHSRGYNNFIGFSNSRIDQYIEAIGKATDQEQKRKLNYKLHELLFNEMPYTFLWSLDKYAAIDKKVQGTENLHPFKFFTYFNKWYIPLNLQ